MPDLLDLPLTTLEGGDTTLGGLTGGRVALVVNVASRCGLTPQYSQLEALHREYADRGFTVLGVPCNQFGGQEPGSAERSPASARPPTASPSRWPGRSRSTARTPPRSTGS